MRLTQRLRTRARTIKVDVHALYLAARAPRVTVLAKVVAAVVAAYALSPIDLIPDFVPILGYLDDLIIVPLGILIAVRLVPADLMAEFREAAQRAALLPGSRAAATVIIGVWLILALALALLSINYRRSVATHGALNKDALIVVDDRS